MKLLSTLALAVAALTFGCAASLVAYAQSSRAWSEENLLAFERCASFMLLGPQYNGIKIDGEGYNCKPLRSPVLLDNGTFEFYGAASHQRTGLPDDEITFAVRVSADGKVLQYKNWWNGGGVLGTIIPGSITTGWYPVPDAPGWTKLSGRALTREVTRGKSLEPLHMPGIFATYVGVRLAQSVRDKNTGLAFGHDRPGRILQTYEMFNGRPFAGVTINDKFPLTYVDACQAICDNFQGCHAWTVTPETAKAKHICQVKTAGTAPQVARNFVSGLRTPQFNRTFQLRLP